jgi:hypothetical protein
MSHFIVMHVKHTPLSGFPGGGFYILKEGLEWIFCLHTNDFYTIIRVVG